VADGAYVLSVLAPDHVFDFVSALLVLMVLPFLSRWLLLNQATDILRVLCFHPTFAMLV
jgi:hypothetical protein